MLTGKEKRLGDAAHRAARSSLRSAPPIDGESHAGVSLLSSGAQSRSPSSTEGPMISLDLRAEMWLKVFLYCFLPQKRNNTHKSKILGCVAKLLRCVAK